MIEFIFTTAFLLLLFIEWFIGRKKRYRYKLDMKSEHPKIIIQSDKPIKLKVEIKGDVDVKIKPV